jgi:hypothetical protein
MRQRCRAARLAAPGVGPGVRRIDPVESAQRTGRSTDGIGYAPVASYLPKVPSGPRARSALWSHDSRIFSVVFALQKRAHDDTHVS